MKHIFLSYSAKDSTYANWLEAELRANDYVVWRDTSKLRGGDEWIEQLETALQDAWAVIVIQSPHSKESRWVRNEIEFAEKQDIPVIPIRLSGEPWFGFLHTQYVDVRGRENDPLPDSFYAILLQYAPPVSLADQIDLQLLESNTPQRLGLIPPLEAIAHRARSPRGEAARQILTRLSRDSDEYVRGAARTALQKLKTVNVETPWPDSTPVPETPPPQPSPPVALPVRNWTRVGLAALAALVLIAVWFIAQSVMDHQDTGKQAESPTTEATQEIAVVPDDPCPDQPKDEIGDPCNPDDDGDTLPDTEDSCPFDTFQDSFRDPCNHDEDGDGVTEDQDLCPATGGSDQGCPSLDASLPLAGPITAENAAQVVQLAQYGRGWVQNAAWLDGGQTLALVGPRGVWLYNSQDFGAEPRRIDSVSFMGQGLAFSPDGTRLAFGSYDTQVHILDMGTGEILSNLESYSEVVSLAYSPDGTLLASGGLDGAVRLWDLGAAGVPRFILTNHAAAVRTLAFSLDGTLLASGGDDWSMRVWEVATGQELYEVPQDQSVHSVAFSPDGTLASANQNGVIHLWDAATGEPRGDHPGSVVAFSPDGTRLAAGHGRQLILHNLATGESQTWDVLTYYGLTGLVFSPDGTRLVTLGNSFGLTQVWDTATGQEQITFGEHPGTVTQVAISPDGTYRAAGNLDGWVRSWSTVTGEVRWIPGPNSGPVGGLAFSPDGTVLVSGSEDSTVRLWNPGTGDMLRDDIFNYSPVSELALSSDGSTLAVGVFQQVYLWDTAAYDPTLTRVLQVPAEGNVVALVFSPDGQTLATGSDTSSSVWLWDVAAGTIRAELTTTGNIASIRSLAFTPDGAVLAVGSADDNILRLWNMENNTALETPWEPFSGWVTGLAFSPDGSVVAVGCFPNHLQLFSSTTYEQLAEFEYPVWGTIWSTAFSADGASLLTGGEDGVTRLWGIPAPQE